MGLHDQPVAVSLEAWQDVHFIGERRVRKTYLVDSCEA